MLRCPQGGILRLSQSGDLWSADGIGFLRSLDTSSMRNFAIFVNYINEKFHLSFGLLGLVSCTGEHHTTDHVKNKTEEVLRNFGIPKVGHDGGIFKKGG